MYECGVLIGYASLYATRCRPWMYYNDLPKGAIMRGDPNWRAELAAGATVRYGDGAYVVQSVDQDAGTVMLIDPNSDEPMCANIAELE
jgi:hypothetical protein